MGSCYQTQQRKALIECFAQNEDKQLTADEVLELLGSAAPGKSTVYRLLKKLCEDGVLRRFALEGSSKSAYQLVGTSCCTEHLHIKCTDCGVLMHLDSNAQEELTKLTGFVIDDARSMLYGRCARCAKAGRV